MSQSKSPHIGRVLGSITIIFAAVFIFEGNYPAATSAAVIAIWIEMAV